MAATIPQRINGKWGKISKKKGQTAADRSLLRVFFSHLPACVASVAGEQFLIPQKKHLLRTVFSSFVLDSFFSRKKALFGCTSAPKLRGSRTVPAPIMMLHARERRSFVSAD
jgi:hypothetical protein